MNYKLKSKENTTPYSWGDHCLGWPLVSNENLSVIEEIMPPHTAEQKHFHERAQQFFSIVKGTATFIIESNTIVVRAGEGIHIPAKTVHQIKNMQETNLEFMVISNPSTLKDRVNVEDTNH